MRREYPCKLLRIDGDLLELNIDLGFDVHVVAPVRLAGCLVPRNGGITKPEGRAAQLWLMSAVRRAEPEDPTPKLMVRTKKSAAPGPMLGELYILGDKTTINERMVQAGHAKRGTR